MKTITEVYRSMQKHVRVKDFCRGSWKIPENKSHGGTWCRKHYLHGPMTWKVMRRNAWKDIANLRIKRLNKYTKSRRHAWLTTNLKKRKIESGGEFTTRRSQPTDDAEARADFWSIQSDFVYRHHNEPRVQLYVPKEETFPIPLKYIDVMMSTRTDLDVMQAKKNGWLLECRYETDTWQSHGEDSRVHRLYSIERKTFQKNIWGPGGGWQRFKRLPDQIMYGQKYGQK